MMASQSPHTGRTQLKELRWGKDSGWEDIRRNPLTRGELNSRDQVVEYRNKAKAQWVAIPSHGANSTQGHKAAILATLGDKPEFVAIPSHGANSTQAER